MNLKKITPLDLKKKKEQGEKIVALTAYDYPTAQLIDGIGTDIILVGDSLGMVVLGYENTLPVTMEEMIHHTRAVTRGVSRALVVGDMPFMTYNFSLEETLLNAGRFIKEAGAHAVKLEGGEEAAGTVHELVIRGIPVLGHVGLTPQHVLELSGYKVQGKNNEAALKIMNDAVCLEQSGAFAIILECIPTQLACDITRRLSIPTIGIGAGVECDGQIMVTHDLLGMYDKRKPKFVKTYAHIHEIMEKALKEYKSEVETGTFPDAEHSY